MYEIFKPNKIRIPYKELKNEYKGKWVYLGNLQQVYSQDENGEYIPNENNLCDILVIADEPYEGSETGIYREISKNGEYGMTGEMDIRLKTPPNTNQIVIKEAAAID